MNYYFIGIKGSGMSSLAEIMYDLGYKVVGYDDDPKPKYTEKALLKKGIKIFYDNSYKLTNETVVYSPAIRSDHPEMERARKKGLKCLLYNEMIGELTKRFETIAICGSHGKTTTTAMLAHIISAANNKKVNYLIGDGTGYAHKNNKLFVLEACEYRRHFLYYYPIYTIITNIDFDHVDYYKDIDDVKKAFLEFTNQTQKMIIACGDDENIRDISFNKEVIYYGFNKNNNMVASNIKLTTDGSSFDVFYNQKFLGHFSLNHYGSHMILNALSVITMANILGLDIENVKKALKSFKGTNRRFTEKIIGDIIIIDDYAHHYNEIIATIEGVRQKYPDKKIIAVYLPNTYSRTKVLYKKEAAALNKADKAYVMDIISDREKPSEWPGVSSNLIIDLLKNGEKIALETVDKLLKHKNSVIIFMSCTSIYVLQQKFEKLLKERKEGKNEIIFKI